MGSRSATPSSPADAAKALFRGHGGVLRTRDALRLGVHPRTLYGLRDAGTLEQVARGLFRLADLPPLGSPDLVAVALKVPKGVVCLISALALHDLTTQVPHEVYVALPRGAEPPRLAYPPLRVFWFSESAFTAGVEEREIDGVPVRVYGAEKAIADCFKYRNKVGVAVAVEALNRYRRRKGFSVDRLMEAARACRVERVMRPYVEAIL
jgi:predicted transcriptional regulator of viral defense system